MYPEVSADLVRLAYVIRRNQAFVSVTDNVTKPNRSAFMVL